MLTGLQPSRKSQDVLSGRKVLELEFEASSAAAKKTKAVDTSAAASSSKRTPASNIQPASTYVSSPVATTSRRTARTKPITGTGVGVTSNRMNGYVPDDDFIVPDDDTDEDDPFSQQPRLSKTMQSKLNPTRTARPTPSATTTTGRGNVTVGTPITGDPQLAGMSEYDLDIMHRFMAEAKKLRAKITNAKGLRVESVFTDTILRSIGITLPTKLVELKTIEGINPTSVQNYGQQFLELARKYADERDINLAGTVADPNGSPMLTPASEESASSGPQESHHFSKSSKVHTVKGKADWIVIDSSDNDDERDEIPPTDDEDEDYSDGEDASQAVEDNDVGPSQVPDDDDDDGTDYGGDDDLDGIDPDDLVGGGGGGGRVDTLAVAMWGEVRDSRRASRSS